MIRLLYLIVLIADSVRIVGCVGTVQGNCASFSNFAPTNPWRTHTRDSTSHPAHSPISKVLQFAVSVSKVELAVEPLLQVAGILAVHLQFAPGYSSRPPEHCRLAPELRQRPPQRGDHI